MNMRPDFTQFPEEAAAGRLPHSSTGFFIAANDHDMMSQVARLMHRQGILGLMDTAGHMHYLVDGRQGSPLAARRIRETSERLMRDQLLNPDDLRPLRLLAIEQVLSAWGLPKKLKGYSLLQQILVMICGNEAELHPISKTVYPALAEQYKLSPSQIERNIRYCLQCRPGHQPRLSNSEAICTLSNEVSRMVAAWANQTKLPASAGEAAGSCEARKDL
jgi:hypothetical protein